MILTYVINYSIIIDISQKQSKTADKEKANGATVQSQKNLFRAHHRRLWSFEPGDGQRGGAHVGGI